MFHRLKSLFSAGPGSTAIDKSKVIPLVKAVVSGGDGREMQLPSDQEPILRPLVGELLVAYVLDEESSFVFLNRANLAELGLSEEELHALALENLPRRMPPLKIHG